MRKVVIALAALAVLSLPALAVDPTSYDDPVTTVPDNGGGGVRTNDCPGTIVWDSGMFDEFTPPTGCATAASAGCFINAVNDGGFPVDGRRLADDWESDGTPITHIKIWARLNAAGYDNGVRPVGFCVKFYEALDNPPWCPDGTVPGEDAIGITAYNEYTQNFVPYEVTTGLPRHFNYCITLPTAFLPTAGRVYFVSVSADYDFIGSLGTQWFWRMYEGLGWFPYCEASWWDTWGTPVNWNAVSVAINQPCWAGWDASFVLYNAGTPPPTGACCDQQGNCTVTTEADCGGAWQGAGTDCDPNPCPPPPNPTETKTWGSIKNAYR